MDPVLFKRTRKRRQNARMGDCSAAIILVTVQLLQQRYPVTQWAFPSCNCCGYGCTTSRRSSELRSVVSISVFTVVTSESSCTVLKMPVHGRSVRARDGPMSSIYGARSANYNLFCSRERSSLAGEVSYSLYSTDCRFETSHIMRFAIR